jgi:integrase
MTSDPSPRQIKLTKSRVDTLPVSTGGQVFYWDTDLKGFGLRVGNNVKCYIAQAKVGGKTVRVTIGRHGLFTPDEARRLARDHLQLMAKGANPNDVKRQTELEQVTLEQAFEEFLAARKNLKPRTIAQYTYILDEYLGDWKKKPLLQLTRDMVASRHQELGLRSHAQANLAMRFLRSALNFAGGRYVDAEGKPLITDSPTRRLSQTKAWYRVERRNTYIKLTELSPWYTAVCDLGQGTTKRPRSDRKRRIVRDYLLLLLLTGLRKGEAATLRWADVDFAAQSLTVRETKNREPHTLPLSDHLVELLRRRREESPGEYVFPGDGARGHIVEVTRQIKRVSRQSGVSFTLHDLRRTFATVAEGLDISAYSVKRLLNHKMRNDVTAGYIVTDVERLRQPMQKITDFTLLAAGGKPPAEIVALDKRDKYLRRPAA